MSRCEGTGYPPSGPFVASGAWLPPGPQPPGAARPSGNVRCVDTTRAVFVDLDRTLLTGASGPVLSEAMVAEGLMSSRMRMPGDRLAYAAYDRLGETLPFMALVRLAASFTRGWPLDAFRRAGERAAPVLARMIQPYAMGVLEEHRAEGARLVLATTTPADLIWPLVELLGFDDLVATRYACSDGVLTGGIEGDFVWSSGKLRAVRSFCGAEGIDLARSHAYSDSVFDLPLMNAVGFPHAVNPDPRLRVFAALRRWPVEHWNHPEGVPTVAGLEPYHLLRPLVRPAAFPYARFNVTGEKNIPATGAVILAANHRSYFDVAALGVLAARIGRPVRFLAKREMLDAVIIGPIARALGGIPVDRGSGSDRPLREAARALGAGEVVVILPQGTIPRGEEFFDPRLKGRTGAARLAAMSGAPVVPIGIWGTEKVWPRSARVPAVCNITHPPEVVVRVGMPMALPGGSSDPRAATRRLLDAIERLVPAEALRDPSAEDLARTYPPGHRPGS